MSSRNTLRALWVVFGVAGCSGSRTDTARTVHPSDAGEDSAIGSGGISGTGGGPSAGGKSGAGGAGAAGAGAAGSGGTSPDGAVCTDCSAMDLRWGRDGGYAAFVDTSRITSCRIYSRERTSMPPLKCTVTLPLCPDRTLDAIVKPLADPAIVAALRDHKLFGNDPRPVDGSVLRIAVANDFIDIGPSCETGCSGMPEALVTLVGLLLSLDERELAAEPCHGVFGT